MANRNLIHALTLALVGEPICLCAGKDPGFFGAGWQGIDWTPDAVEAAFKKSPRLNIGLKLGPRWGGVIDIEGDGPGAVEAWQQFTSGVPLSPTPRWNARRGQHSLWKLTPDQFAKLREVGASSVFKLGDLEFRLGNDGGALQSIIPPSTTDGFTRAWEVSIFDCPVAPLPGVLFERLLAAINANPTKPQTATAKKPPSNFGQRPGDVYNERATWEDILEPLGWSCVGDYEDVQHWCRPGKTDAVSATTGFCKSDCRPDCFYIFSTADEIEPFAAHRTYSKFEAFALIHHGVTSNV